MDELLQYIERQKDVCLENFEYFTREGMPEKYIEMLFYDKLKNIEKAVHEYYDLVEKDKNGNLDFPPKELINKYSNEMEEKSGAKKWLQVM